MRGKKKEVNPKAVGPFYCGFEQCSRLATGKSKEKTGSGEVAGWEGVQVTSQEDLERSSSSCRRDDEKRQ